MGKFNSFEEINSWQKQEFLIREFTKLLKIQISRKTLISLDKLGEHQFLFHQI